MALTRIEYDYMSEMPAKLKRIEDQLKRIADMLERIVDVKTNNQNNKALWDFETRR